MIKVTSKFLKELVTYPNVVDLTKVQKGYKIPELTHKIMYVERRDGCNGFALLGEETGKLYVVTHACTAIYLF